MKLKALYPLRQILILCLTLFPATGCFIVPPSLQIDSHSEEGGRNSRRNESRGTGECDRDRRCESICHSIFTSLRAWEECEELDIVDVEQMEEAIKVLEDPEWDDLEALDLSVLNTLMKISLNPVETAIGRMTKSEKKRFLEWLVIKPDTAKTWVDGEFDFEILKALIGSGKETILHDLKIIITSGENFFTLAMEENNEVVLKWLHDFFEYICNRESSIQKCVFQDFYCHLSLDSEEEEDLFNFDFFSATLDEVLSDPDIRPSRLSDDHWWNEGTDAGDLDRWKTSPHNVCQCLETNGSTCPDED